MSKPKPTDGVISIPLFPPTTPNSKTGPSLVNVVEVEIGPKSALTLGEKPSKESVVTLSKGEKTTLPNADAGELPKDFPISDFLGN